LSGSDKNSNRSNPARTAAGREVARLTDENYSNRKKLAEECGIKVRTFYDLLAGRKRLDADLAKQLAPALGVERQYLLGLEAEFRENAETSKQADNNSGKTFGSPEPIGNKAFHSEMDAKSVESVLSSGRGLSATVQNIGAIERKPLADKPRIFVAMPFADDFTDFYEFGVRQTAEKVGYECERIDEVEFNGSISQEILKRIDAADLLVAEVSMQNANVYYELAWAQAKGKPTILCTKDLENLPFDTRDLNHIVYSSVYSLIAPLEKRLKSQTNAEFPKLQNS
jgi:plasmid maintenance system antidote protein VapI